MEENLIEEELPLLTQSEITSVTTSPTLSQTTEGNAKTMAFVVIGLVIFIGIIRQ